MKISSLILIHAIISVSGSSLRPGEEHLFVSASSGSVQRYMLQGLIPGAWYESVVSYPATTPALFSLWLESDSAQRSLLNTEKLIFQGEDGLALNVRAQADGVAATRGSNSIQYSIRIERLVFNLIPQSAIFVGLIAICIVMGVFAKIILFY